MNHLYRIPNRITSRFSNTLPLRSTLITAELIVKGGSHYAV